ncbi:MAG TPA: DUF2339 domain-containing protein [Actinomycetota bacterium]|nr:DUF2339 domain-containing protein [Actinomycetota bacterium]
MDRELIRRVERLEREVADLRGRVAGGRPERRTAPPPPPPHLVRPRPAPPRPTTPSADAAAEATLVGTWFARIGVVAILLGAAFAFKYAVDRGLIGPTGRVAIGVAVGLAFVGWGEHAARVGWPRLAQAVTGGGVGLLYLSLWAGFALYGLFPAPVAFLALGSVVAAAAVLSLRHDSVALAIVSLVGGFLNPYVTGIARDPTSLFAYVLLLDVGILAIAAGRRWRAVEATAMAGTWAVVLAASDGAPLATAQAFATLFFAVFAARALLHAWRGRRTEGADLPLLGANAWAYFWTGMAVLPDDARGPFTFALAALHGALAAVAAARRPEDRALWLGLAGLAAAFFTVAVPIQLDGPQVAITWAAQGTAMVWIGCAARMPSARAAGASVVALSLLASLVVDFELGFDYRPERLAASIESLTLVLQVAALSAVGWLLAREPGGGWERRLAPVAFGGAHAVAVLWLSLEARVAMGFPTEAGDPGRHQALLFAYTAIWALYAGGLLAVGVAARLPRARLFAVSLFGITLGKLVLVDLWRLEPLHRTLAFTGLGVLLLVGSVMYHRFRHLILEGR